MPSEVPGQELVEAGLAALEQGEWTVEALLVAVGAPRLRLIGLRVPDLRDAPEHPELALYQALGRIYPDDAYSRYNALIRRLVSYEQEMERRKYASPRAQHPPDKAPSHRGPLSGAHPALHRAVGRALRFAAPLQP